MSGQWTSFIQCCLVPFFNFNFWFFFLVSVTLGPVIGKVTATSAIILLEVDRSAEVLCHLHASPSGQKVATLAQKMPANKPKVRNFAWSDYKDIILNFSDLRESMQCLKLMNLISFYSGFRV